MFAKTGAIGELACSRKKAFFALFLTATLVALLMSAGPAQAQGQTEPVVEARTEDQKLTATDGVVSGRFGVAVAVSGDTMVIGATGVDDDPDLGAGTAYVFVRDGANWVFEAQLTPSDVAPGAEFGSSVAISGDAIVVSSYVPSSSGDGATNSVVGSAHVFVRDGNSWSETAKLTATDGVTSDGFGQSVSIFEDTIVVGAWRADAAYVFVHDGADWSEEAKLTPPDSDPSDFDRSDFFGISVSASDGVVVVGAFGRESVYVFMRDGADWVPEAELTASDAGDSDRFGVSVSISGETIVVGTGIGFAQTTGTAPGAAYVYVRDVGGWSEEAKLTAPDDGFGTSVAVFDETVVVGVFDNSESGAPPGAVRVFVRDGGEWNEQAKLTASDAVSNDQFGIPVALFDDTIVVGAPGPSDGSSSSAYVFELDSDTESDSDGDTEADPVLSVSGRVFDDANGNGVADGAEQDVSGVDVDLFAAGADGELATSDDALLASTTTASPFEFFDIDDGTYLLVIDTSTLPTGFVAGAGAALSTEVTVADGTSTATDFALMGSAPEVPVLALTGSRSQLFGGIGLLLVALGAGLFAISQKRRFGNENHSV